MIIKENNLKTVLMEAVCEILTELDWKTYNSAANKDKRVKRANQFADARNKSFNNDYGYNDDNTSIEMNSFEKQPTLNVRLNNDDNVELFNIDGKRNYYNHSINSKDGYNNIRGTAELPSSPNNKVARKLSKAHNEFSDFNKGNYKYHKGNGYKNIADTSIERPDETPNTNSSKAQDWHNFIRFDEL